MLICDSFFYLEYTCDSKWYMQINTKCQEKIFRFKFPLIPFLLLLNCLFFILTFDKFRFIYFIVFDG